MFWWIVLAPGIPAHRDYSSDHSPRYSLEIQEQWGSQRLKQRRCGVRTQLFFGSQTVKARLFEDLREEFQQYITHGALLTHLNEHIIMQ